jgi:hypothetical protein
MTSFNVATNLLAGTALLLVSVISVKPASAASVLYYRDYVIGTDAMEQALSALSSSGNSVTIASDSTQFESLISNSTFDLGIFFAQGYSADSYTSAINALGNFVSTGGKAIYADWSRNSGLAAQFGASFTGGSPNQNQMTVQSPQLGLGTYAFNSPGWGIYTTGLAALPGSSVLATFPGSDAAIVRSGNGRSIVNGFLSDTFSDGTQGKALYTAQISSLLDQPTAVPTPALLPGLIGLGMGVLRKRKAEAAKQAVEV